MNLKQQIEMQRRYSAQAGDEPRRAADAARTMRDPDDMDKGELIEFLEGVGIEIDRRWGVDRLRSVMKGEPQ